jgi:LysR family glycine cleavage system transcriptional activator
MSKLHSKTASPRIKQSQSLPPDTCPPPLNAVRVFAEAARQCNFSRAAQNLGMTQSGVSRHIGNLEKWLGQSLFLRSGGQLALTDVGRLYQESVKEAVATIDLISRQLKARGNQMRLPALTVRTSLPTFSMTVLIPALSRFQAAHHVDVEVMTTLSPPLPGDKCDVLVTRDLVIADAEQWHLVNEELVCVATPSLRDRCEGQPIETWPYLAARSRPDILLRWTSALGIDANQIQISTGFDHLFLAIAAASSGVGVLVVPRFLVADSVRQGLLCELTGGPVQGNSNYVAVVHPATHNPDTARAFCRWLKGILAQERR